MTFIFTKLVGVHKPIALFLSYLNQEVYYIELTNKGLLPSYVEKLFSRNIKPLPIENIETISDNKLCEGNDWEYSGLEYLTEKALPRSIINLYSQEYENISNLPKKLRLIFKTHLPIRNIGRAVIFSKSNKENNCLIICHSLLELMLPIKESNIQKIFLPSLSFLSFLITKIKLKIKTIRVLKKRNSFDLFISDEIDDKIIYVTHKGLTFHNLFKKKLFYGDGLLKKESMLHLSYSGNSNNEEGLRWIYVKNNLNINIHNVSLFFKLSFKSILKTRTKEQVIGSFFLSISYLKYKNYLKQIQHLSNLKFALIDYEILCPKQLLMAFESLSIQTIAVQERYLRMFYNSTGAFLNYYFCASDFSEEKLRQNSSYIIDHYIPIGQYRSDALSITEINDLPLDLIEAKEMGKKVIVAIAYNVSKYEHIACVDPLLSWSAHNIFLEDMVSLAKELEDSFIIIRCMDSDWMNLPIFKDVINRINYSDNISISKEYTKDLQSYNLCSYADLVIAKHTSLGDECLSRNIPVLFYDYSHNRSSLFSFIYDYQGSGIMCNSYEDLLSKSIESLDKGLDMKNINQIYGDYNDGQVKNRIQMELVSIFEKEHLSENY